MRSFLPLTHAYRLTATWRAFLLTNQDQLRYRGTVNLEWQRMFVSHQWECLHRHPSRDEAHRCAIVGLRSMRERYTMPTPTRVPPTRPQRDRTTLDTALTRDRELRINLTNAGFVAELTDCNGAHVWRTQGDGTIDQAIRALRQVWMASQAHVAHRTIGPSGLDEW